MNTLRKMKHERFWSFLGGCIAALGFFYLIFLAINYFDDRQLAVINSDPAMADGLIVKTGSKKGSYAVARYFAGGKGFTINQSSPADDIHKGQKFKIKYYRADPGKARILFEIPFFDVTDKFDSTYDRVRVIDRFKIKFEYAVNAIQDSKFQKREESVPLNNNAIFRFIN